MKVSPISILCLVCIGLILYGSLMPFDFHLEGSAAGQRLERALGSWSSASRSDLWMNFLLYLPLGFLLATRWRFLGRNRLMAAAGAAVVGLGLSIGVEFAQLFLPSRTSQIHDVASNTAGGLGGAVFGSLLGQGICQGIGRFIQKRWKGRISSAGAAVMCVMLILDGLAPLMPVRSLSDLGHNFRGSILSLGDGLAVHPWHRWLVCRIGVFAVLAILLGAARNHERRRWLWGGALALGFAFLLEAAKPFIYMRIANAANVATAACGTAVGLALAAALSHRLSTRSRLNLAVVLLVLYAAYWEWVPFAFAWNPALVAKKLPAGSDWLPLSNLALRGHEYGDAHRFLRNIVLMCVLAYLLREKGGWYARGSRPVQILKGGLATGLLGAALEGGQFLLPGRSPSTTELLAFSVGGAVGIWLHMLAAQARSAAFSVYPSGGETTRVRVNPSRYPDRLRALMTRRRLALAVPVAALVLSVMLWLLPGGDGVPLEPQTLGRLQSQADPDTFRPFHFVQVGDPQIGFGEDGIAADSERFASLVREVNRFKPEFVFIAGDLTYHRSREETKAMEEVIRLFEIPVHVVPGNHEIVDHATLDSFRQRWGRDYYVLTHNNCDFIFLNSILLSETSPWFKQRDERFLREVAKQWTWLEAALESARAKKRNHIFLLMHVPPFVQDEEERAQYENLPLQARKRLLGLVLEYNVRAILCGHLHKNVEIRSQPPIYIAAGTAKVLGYSGYGYRVFAVTKYDLKQKFFELKNAGSGCVRK